MSSLTSKAAQKELGLVINDRGLTVAVIPLTVTDETAFWLIKMTVVICSRLSPSRGQSSNHVLLKLGQLCSES